VPGIRCRGKVRGPKPEPAGVYDAVILTPVSRLLPFKYEGDSGDVDENKGSGFARSTMMRTFRPFMIAFVLAVSLASPPATSAQQRLVIHSPDIHLAGPHGGSASKYTLHTSGMTVDLSLDGKIVGIELGKRKLQWSMLGETALAGCHVAGVIESSQGKDKNVQFRKKLVCELSGVQRGVRLVERFTPNKDSIRWEIDVDGQGSPGPPRSRLGCILPSRKRRNSGPPGVIRGLTPTRKSAGWMIQAGRTRSSRRHSPIARCGTAPLTIDSTGRALTRSCLSAMSSAFLLRA